MSDIKPYTKNLEDDHPETFRLVLEALKLYNRRGLNLPAVSCYVKTMLEQRNVSDLQLKEFVTSALRRAVELGFALEQQNGTYVLRSGLDARLPSGPDNFQVYYRPPQQPSKPPTNNFPQCNRTFMASRGSQADDGEPSRFQDSPLPEGPATPSNSDSSISLGSRDEAPPATSYSKCSFQPCCYYYT